MLTSIVLFGLRPKHPWPDAGDSESFSRNVKQCCNCDCFWHVRNRNTRLRLHKSCCRNMRLSSGSTVAKGRCAVIPAFAAFRNMNGRYYLSPQPHPTTPPAVEGAAISYEPVLTEAALSRLGQLMGLVLSIAVAHVLSSRAWQIICCV